MADFAILGKYCRTPLASANRLAMALFIVGGLGGCATLTPLEDACEMANRQPSFAVLMQNSLMNVYNMCLEHMRQEIVTEWGAQ